VRDVSESDSLQVRLLGTVDVVLCGAPQTVPGLRRKAVLAALALNAGEVVSTDRLVDVVWGERAPATALNTLQSNISYLRKVLKAPAVIVARAPGYVLAGAPDVSDFQLAERLIRQAGQSPDPNERARQLQAALALWRGRSLDDLCDLPWFAEQSERMERVRRAAIHASVDARMVHGEHAVLVPELERLVEQFSFDEVLHGQLMLALYRAGRQHEAFAIFRRLRHRLNDELGIDPGPSLRDLEAAILRQDASLDPPTTVGVVRPAVGGISTAGLTTVVSSDEAGALVERSREVQLIDKAFSRAETERSGSLLIFEGPAGIGKTSLMNHALVFAQRDGFTVASACGIDLEQEYAWGYVRRLFERHPHVVEAAKGGALALDLLTGWEQPVVDAPLGEFPLIHSLFWLVSDMAAQSPLLIIADDLHWADISSARFLAYLAARLEGLPVVLLIALRPGFDRVEHIVSAMAKVTHWRPDTLVPLNTLAPLTTEGATQLLADVLMVEPDGDLVARCMELTGGNPFLLLEMGRQIAASHDADAVGDVLRRVAPSITRFVGLQLGQLPLASRAIAQTLAVLGDGATADVLSEVGEVPLRTVLDGLTRLRVSGLVGSAGVPERFTFSHPLIQAAIYNEMGAGNRAELHLRASHAARRRLDVIRAAIHLLRVPPGLGGLESAAILVQAAESCLARGAVDNAVAYLRRYLEEDIGDQRLSALTRLGMTEILVDTRQAAEHLSTALKLETDAERRAEIALALAGALFFAGMDQDAVNVCQSALREPSAISVSTRRQLQASLVNLSKTTRAGLTLISDVEAIAEQPPDNSTGGLMLDAALSMHEAYLNRRDATRERALRAIAGDVLVGHPMAEGPLSSAWHALEMCDEPLLLPSIDAAIDCARSAGSLRAFGSAALYRTAVLLARGHLIEAASDAKACWEVFETSSIDAGLPFVGEYLMRTLVATGQLAEAESVLADVIAACPQGIRRFMYAEGEMEVLIALGQTEPALRRAMETRDECLETGAGNIMFCDWRTQMVRCLTSLGRAEEAREIAHELREVADTWGTPRAVGRSFRVAALAESGSRRISMLEASVHVLEESEARLELATSRHLLGKALLQQDRLADARAQLRQASDLANVCGAVVLQRDAAAVLRLLGTDSGQSVLPGPMSLTPNEVRVADLAIQGLSNREIAERLYTTVTTVEQQVSTTFRKLGINQRSDLARALGR
jgi:DNA-binding SARP family transcriptional activator/DNA-binding NarL/FixJ family response regulator